VGCECEVRGRFEFRGRKGSACGVTERRSWYIGRSYIPAECRLNAGGYSRACAQGGGP